jgi:creatinase
VAQRREASSPFSDLEIDRRQRLLRNHLDVADLDAALLTSIDNIGYFAGFIYCSFGRDYGLVIDAENATTISAAIDGGQPWRRTHGNNITYTDWQKENFFYALQGLTSGITRLGIEFDHVTIALRSQLEAALPGIELVDVYVETMWMRSIKSDEEIAHITTSPAIADVGGVACVEAIAAGVGEHEVAFASTQAMTREIAKTWSFAELMDTWTWFQAGLNTDGAHNPVTNSLIEAGDILSINCFPMSFGYYVALERTLFCEAASDKHLRLWEINCDVHRAGPRSDRTRSALQSHRVRTE